MSNRTKKKSHKSHSASKSAPQRIIIDSNSIGIVVKETPITISDEKINSILRETYDLTVIEVNKFKFYSLWKTLWSVSCTLVITLLTSSSYNSIGAIDGKVIKIIFLTVCVGAFLMGLFFLIVDVYNKNSINKHTREAVINDVLKKYKINV